MLTGLPAGGLAPVETQPTCPKHPSATKKRKVGIHGLKNADIMLGQAKASQSITTRQGGAYGELCRNI